MKTKRREAYLDTIKIPKQASDILSAEIGSVGATLHKLAH